MGAEPLRITYVLPAPELGGGIKVVLQHAALLAARGHQLTLLGEGPAPDWFPVTGAYYDTHQGLPRLPRQDLVIATFFTTFHRAVDLGAGPVAHFCQGYEGGLVHLAPMLSEIERVYAWPLPALVVSPHLGEFLLQRFGRPSFPAPPPLDPAFHPRWRWRPRRRPWVMVPGVFEAEVKNIAVALDAVSQLRAGGIPARLLRLSTLPLTTAEKALLAPDEYLRGVRPAQVAAVLRRMDLLLFPSRAEEGFGLPLLEAMASKVPAVASRIPSVAGFATAGVAQVDPADPAAFARAAQTLLTDPAAWRRARAAGFVAAQRYQPEQVAPVLEASLRAAAGASRGVT